MNQTVIAFVRGTPKLTGYYWVNNVKQVHRRDHQGVIHTETYFDRGASAHFGLAEVRIKSDGLPHAWIHGFGEIGTHQLDREEWVGPLPVPVIEEWIGIETDALKRKQEYRS